MKCTNCQYENDPSARFCSQCGMPLNGAQAVPDAAQTTRRSEARASAQTERSPYARPLPASGTPDAPHTAARQTAPRRNPLAADGRQDAGMRRAAAPRRDPLAAAGFSDVSGGYAQEAGDTRVMKPQRAAQTAAYSEDTSAQDVDATRVMKPQRAAPADTYSEDDSSQDVDATRIMKPQRAAQTAAYSEDDSQDMDATRVMKPQRGSQAVSSNSRRRAPVIESADYAEPDDAQDEQEQPVRTRNTRAPETRRRTQRGGEYARKRPTEPIYDPDEMEDDENDEQEIRRTTAKPHRNKLMIGGIVLLSLMALLLLVICFLTFTPTGQRWKATIGLNAPATAYWQLGDEALEAGDAAKAAEYYESALSRDSSDYDGAVRLAQTLMSIDNTERAERAYRLAITLRPTESAPYEQVISLMRARNASESEMVSILRLAYQNTADENYHTQLLEYGPSPVRFDPEEGEYSYAIKLQMASDEGAVIYYTTDGSQPTIYSSKYVLPIELGEGVFNVRAIAYLNDLYSGESSKTYTIAFPTVEAPQFASKPGKYSADDDGAKVIKVNVPDSCTVFYTTDGSEPTADSSEYSDGIRLKPGTYKVRMIARNADGVFSSETNADYEIIGELKAAFSDEDRFKSFYVDVTTQDDVNKQFKKLVSTSGDTNTFFTQHYSFGEVDFTVKNGTPVVTAVRIINNDIRGVRDTKVGWAAEDVIALFRDEKHARSGSERELYTLDNDQYGWVEYDSNDEISSINYMYTRNGNQLVELHYTVTDGKVSAMEYCISDM